MASFSELQRGITDNLRRREYKTAYDIIEAGVDDGVIEELRGKDDPRFNEAVSRALRTSSNGSPIYKGRATVVVTDIEGNIKWFFSNNEDSPDHATFVKAAIEKATIRALFEKEKRKGGLSHHEKYLLEQGYKRHEGAAIKPLVIEGKEYFIGVSGAAVNESFNRKALRSPGLFMATKEKDPEWRAAGYWDRFCANRIRTKMLRTEGRQDMGRMLIPRHQAKRKIFD